VKIPRDERYVYVATYERPMPLRAGTQDATTLVFCNCDMRMARDHAEYVAWCDNNRLVHLRRATPEETTAFRQGDMGRMVCSEEKGVDGKAVR